MASGVKGAGRGGLSHGFRRALIVSQIAIATIVVSAASLSLTSLVHAQRVDLGFEPGHVLTARVVPHPVTATLDDADAALGADRTCEGRLQFAIHVDYPRTVTDAEEGAAFAPPDRT